MTEGELKKRLKENSFPRTVEAECGCALTITDELDVSLKEAKKLIDEAKKEFWVATPSTIISVIQKWFGDCE